MEKRPESGRSGGLPALNRRLSAFGLVLTEEDVRELAEERRVCLAEQQRVEFGPGILEKLADAFCDSVFVGREDFAQTLGQLQSIFYRYKNESMDRWTDDELIGLMKEAFEGECQGSLEYLEEIWLEDAARRSRAGEDGGKESRGWA